MTPSMTEKLIKRALAPIVERIEKLEEQAKRPDHEPGCQSGDFGPCDCSLSRPHGEAGK